MPPFPDGPTCPVELLPDLPARILPAFLTRLRQVFPATLVGLYVTGSIPLGDYHKGKSDIDFLVLLHELPDAAQLDQCAALHQELERQPHRPNFSGYYLTLTGLTAPQPHFPSFFDGRLLSRRPFELASFTLFEWQTTALTLWGPPARDLLPPVPVDRVLAELHQNLNDYWRQWLAGHAFPRSGYWPLLLFPRLTEWGVLGVARQLYTLDTHHIASKYAAGQYCLSQLPTQHQPVMHTALNTRQLNQTQLKPSPARARQTLSCMAWLLAEFNRRYAAPGIQPLSPLR